MIRVLLLLLFLLGGCFRQADETLHQMDAVASSPARPTLLGRYQINVPVNGTVQPSYAGIRYTPHLPGGDTLTLPRAISQASYGRADWLVLSLNRKARLTVTPSRGTLSWLAGWTKSGNSYWKEFPAGTVTLGSPAPATQPYTVSFLEAGGQPSVAPSTPDNQPLPQPNQPCPAWVHDQYQALGPDGQMYPTWHPQIDPVYWCYFGHEHGSQPPAGYTPLYGYTAARHGMTEPGAGFKTSTIKDGNATWVFTQHFGTSGLGRACTRFHTVDVAYLQGTTLKADLHFMGDFGSGATATGQTTQPITSCPPADLAARSTLGADKKLLTTGTRVLNLWPNVGYEPWRLSAQRLVFALGVQSMIFDTGDTRTQCADVACSSLKVRAGVWGVDHRVMFNAPLTLKAAPGASGVFYTDPLGEKLMAAGEAMATRQYIAPGLNVSGPAGTCWTPDAWVGLMSCGGKLLAPNKVLENGITAGN